MTNKAVRPEWGRRQGMLITAAKLGCQREEKACRIWSSGRRDGMLGFWLHFCCCDKFTGQKLNKGERVWHTTTGYSLSFWGCQGRDLRDRSYHIHSQEKESANASMPPAAASGPWSFLLSHTFSRWLITAMQAANLVYIIPCKKLPSQVILGTVKMMVKTN